MKKNVIALLALFTSVVAFAQEVETKTESELGNKLPLGLCPEVVYQT